MPGSLPAGRDAIGPKPRERRTRGVRRSFESGWWTRRGLASGLALEALLEALDLAGGVDDRLLAREERVAVAADVDAQLGRVEPTVHSVPHEPQWTLAW